MSKMQLSTQECSEFLMQGVCWKWYWHPGSTRSLVFSCAFSTCRQSRKLWRHQRNSPSKTCSFYFLEPRSIFQRFRISQLHIRPIKMFVVSMSHWTQRAAWSSPTIWTNQLRHRHGWSCLQANRASDDALNNSILGQSAPWNCSSAPSSHVSSPFLCNFSSFSSLGVQWNKH